MSSAVLVEVEIHHDEGGGLAVSFFKKISGGNGVRMAIYQNR